MVYHSILCLVNTFRLLFSFHCNSLATSNIPCKLSVFPVPIQQFWTLLKETTQPHYICCTILKLFRPSILSIISPLLHNYYFKLPLLQDPNITIPLSLPADDFTSYFVGKSEFTREKFSFIPSTSLSIAFSQPFLCYFVSQMKTCSSSFLRFIP